jgi:sugar diacid utilization regulator
MIRPHGRSLGKGPLGDLVDQARVVAEAAGCTLEAARATDGTWWCSPPGPSEATVAEALASSTETGGGWQLSLPDRPWSFAYDLGPGKPRVLAVVSATHRPSESRRQGLRLSFVGLRANLARGASRATADRHRSILRAIEPRLSPYGVMRAARDIHRSLSEPLADGAGLPGMIQALANLVGNPVAVMDDGGRCVASAGFGPGVTVADVPAPVDDPAADLRDQAEGWVTCMARSGELVLGCVIAWDPEETFGDAELLAVEAASDIAAVELARLSGDRDEHRDRCQVLCAALLSGNLGEADALADELSFALDSARRVVLVAADSEQPGIVDAVMSTARESGVLPVVSPLNGRVALVPERDVDWRVFSARLASRAQATWRVGIGGAVPGPDMLKESLHQADVALRVGSALELAPVTFFEDLGVYALVASSAAPLALDAFIERWLGPLIEYDRKHRIELIRTLGQYLEHGGALDHTADALFVHRSTLKYRLGRIREITGYDLGDADTRFNLQFATRAKATVDSLRSREAENAAGSGAGPMTVPDSGQEAEPA